MTNIKKKGIVRAAIFVLVLMLIVPNISFAKGYTHIYIEDTEIFLNNSPRYINGALCVPFREFSEIFGCTIDWFAEDETAVASGDGIKLVVQKGNTMGKNGANMTALDAPPTIINSTMYVPMSFMCEAMGVESTLSTDGSRLNIRRLPITVKVLPKAQMNASVGSTITLSPNPSSQYSPINMNTSGTKATTYYKFSYEEIGEFVSAKLIVPLNRVNAGGTLSLYKMTEEWTDTKFGAYELLQTGNTVLPEGAELPKTESKAFASKSGLVYGQTTFDIDLTEYLKAEVQSGTKEAGVHFCYNTATQKDTTDGLRINNITAAESSRVRIELTLEPKPLNLEGKTGGSIEVVQTEVSASVRRREVDGVVASHTVNRASSGNELNTIITSGSERAVIYYEADIDKASNAFMAISSRALCEGTLNIYKAKLSADGKITPAGSALDSQLIKPDGSYKEIQFDVSSAIESGKMCVMLEFIPAQEGISPCFYIKSLGSDEAPYVYTIQRVN